MGDYDSVSKRGVLGGMGLIGCSLAALVLAIFVGGALYVVYLNTLGKATADAQFNVTRHTQQYVQTQQQVILSYYAEYQSAIDDAHKNSARINVCSTAAFLDANEYPAQVAPFIAQNCN